MLPQISPLFNYIAFVVIKDGFLMKGYRVSKHGAADTRPISTHTHMHAQEIGTIILDAHNLLISP